ncbi:MAG: hypothetical protein R6X28_04665 [Bacteroidales bacterium]
MKTLNPGGENATPLIIDILLCVILLPAIIIAVAWLVVHTVWNARNGREQL